MTKDRTDSMYPERYPERYQRCKCVLCKTCWFDKKYQMCLYGGPFAGYADAYGKPKEIT